MKSPLLILHKAIGDRIVSRTGREIFDDTPENEKFPYITMGALVCRDWSDKFVPGQEVHSTTHQWSQYPGKKEILEVNDEVLQALTRPPPLDLGPGFRAVVDGLDTNEIIMDIDGFTRHGILTLRYLIEEA